MINPIARVSPGLAGVWFFATIILMEGPARAAAEKVQFGYCSDDLEKAKQVGFDYVEMPVRDFARLSDEEFAKLLEKHKAARVATPVGNVFLPAQLKVVGPEIDKNAQMAYVGKTFDRAAKLGLKIIVFGSGGSRRTPEGFSRDEAWKQLVDFARRIAPEAQKRHLVVAVEPLQKRETNTINSAAEGLALVEAVGHPNFQLMVDFYHLSLEKEDPSILVKARKHLRHIHIANPNGRTFPQSADEYDYSGFFANLRQIEYQGRISVEGRVKDLDREGPRALAFLRSAWKDGVKPPGRPRPSRNDRDSRRSGERPGQKPMASTSGTDPARDPVSDSDPAPAGRAVRVFATLAVLALVGSYVGAQIDFLRRHHPGIPPLRYWLPQVRTIWAPGLAVALFCAGAAFALHRWRRGK